MLFLIIGGNVVASILLMVIADATAQNIEMKMITNDDEDVELNTYDWERTYRMGLLGIFSAHYLFGWYHVLDWAIPGRNITTVLKKAIVDNFATIPYSVLLLSINSILAEGNAKRVISTIKTEIVDVSIVTFLIWFPEDLLMFTLIPMKYWIISVKGFDLIYLPIMSYIANRNVSNSRTKKTS